MAKTFFERIKSFIISPKKAFEAEHKTSTKEAIIYGLKGFLVLAIPYSLIFGVITALAGSPIGFFIIPALFLLMWLGGFLGLLVASLWYHVWAYVFGAKQGLGNTVKALFFGSTPTYVLGWIPIVNFAVGIWSIVLFGLGLTKLQKLSTARAVGAILTAVLIPVILIIAVLVGIFLIFGPAIFASNQTTSTFSVPY